MVRKETRFPELSYASSSQPRLARWFIRSVEGLSGRDRYARLYEIWRREVTSGADRIFGRLLELIDLSVRSPDPWPPAIAPQTPLVIIANHPFGIGDGVAVLALAEQLGRPFRVMIHSDLLKIREMEPYALPVDFSETREAVKNNLAVRHQALNLLKQGVTIVIFPAGGVATAPKGFGSAQDLPRKVFVARLVQDAKATVIPLYFAGQNGRLFHLVSRPMHLAESDKKLAHFVGRLSLTLRTSLLIREFARLSGRAIDVRIGQALAWEELAPYRDRKALLQHLHGQVLSLAPSGHARRGRFGIGRRSRSPLPQSTSSTVPTAAASVVTTSTS
jgi:putative hemolysin